MRKSSFLIGAAIIGILVCGAWTFAGRKDVKPHKLTILFTGDDLGMAKPCG